MFHCWLTFGLFLLCNSGWCCFQPFCTRVGHMWHVLSTRWRAELLGHSAHRFRVISYGSTPFQHIQNNSYTPCSAATISVILNSQQNLALSVKKKKNNFSHSNGCILAFEWSFHLPSPDNNEVEHLLFIGFFKKKLTITLQQGEGSDRKDIIQLNLMNAYQVLNISITLESSLMPFPQSILPPWSNCWFD